MAAPHHEDPEDPATWPRASWWIIHTEHFSDLGQVPPIAIGWARRPGGEVVHHYWIPPLPGPKP